MHIEEAIAVLKELQVKGCFSQRMAAAVAIVALEKQLPKKPRAEYDGYADGAPVYDLYYCPLCDALLEDYDNEPHHCVCGQALDWSEVE